MKHNLCALVLIVVLIDFNEINGHGMLLVPAGRSSRWRYNSSAPLNYNDNALNCGGFGTQWDKYNGKCGLCGDDYGLPTPRPNEIGGYYGGKGVIVRSYTNTHTAKLCTKITANHLGYYYFNICNLDKFERESEECFNKQRLHFANGSKKLCIGKQLGWVNTTIVFPEGLSCKHCVLRFTYRAGNNWGTCKNGTGALGCGPQEHFKSCADIRIKAPNKAKTIKLKAKRKRS